MEIETHKEVSHTLSFTQAELHTLSTMLNTYDRDILDKLPGELDLNEEKYIIREIRQAVQEGQR